MDLPELIYRALKRHLGTDKDKDEALLRMIAQRIVALWSKVARAASGPAPPAKAMGPQRNEEWGKEIRGNGHEDR